MKSGHFSYTGVTKRVTESVVVVLFSAVLLAQFLNILFRYTKIHEPWMWVGEFSRYAFIWIFFLLWHQCDRKGSHFVVDVLTAKLTGRVRAAIELFGRLAALLFALLVVWSSAKYIPTTLLYSTDSFRWLPMGVVYFIIPVGLLLVFIEQLFSLFGGRRKEESESPL